MSHPDAGLTPRHRLNHSIVVIRAARPRTTRTSLRFVPGGAPYDREMKARCRVRAAFQAQDQSHREGRPIGPAPAHAVGSLATADQLPGRSVRPGQPLRRRSSS